MNYDHPERAGALIEFREFLEASKTESTAGIVVPLLQKMQQLFGYIPQPLVKEASDVLQIPSSEIYGVATFYSQFSMEPKGKYVINICLGTACYVKGAQLVLEEVEKTLHIKNGETSDDGMYTIDTTRCVGACGLAPVMEINGHVYGKVTPDQVDVILAELEEMRDVEVEVEL